jgi:tRNA modification GTPase
MTTLDTDTIAAIATPRGNGPVGIVRLSGPKSLDIAQLLTRSELQPRYAHYRSFFSKNHDPIDSGLAIYFPKPRSFTGEHVVEIQAHGGHIVLNSLLSRCLELGARSARPGEFSERSFLNGKIDLLQAEAIADLINAETETAATLATASLSGAFSALVDELSKTLTELRALTEASIDFPDEDIDVMSQYGVISRLQECLKTISQLLATVSASQRKTQRYSAVLIGAPNAGKSSLLNALAHDDVAIVTSVAGTTRDTLKHSIITRSVAIDIIDTAGIRESNDLIEQEGVRRAKASTQTADLVLNVVDDCQPNHIDSSWLPDNAIKINIHNKIDLSGRQPGRFNSDTAETCVALSATNNLGVECLIDTIDEVLLSQGQHQSEFSARARHNDALGDAYRLLEASLVRFNDHNAAELLSEDLKSVQTAIDSLTGKISSDDILGEIFSSFCIGK